MIEMALGVLLAFVLLLALPWVLWLFSGVCGRLLDWYESYLDWVFNL